MGKNIKIEVVQVKEDCSAGHKVGDNWVLENRGCLVWPKQQQVCPELLHNLFPAAMTMSYDGKLPWEKAGKAAVACPDPFSCVIVEISVVEAKKDY